MEVVYIISSVGMLLLIPLMVSAFASVVINFKNLNKGLDRIEERLEEHVKFINKL